MFDYMFDWGQALKMLRKSETLSPKEYGEMLQKRKNKNKKRRGAKK